ncbi:nitroreductase family protein [Caproiciproducens sp.]|uniref:nitroreductase family protein n=1 Tax=Caproiciproducens sp. TaxID=1954376 RepID=UPI002897DB54|nr:nitroreductase family protein [Caproiciproducens sp.]
MEKNFCEAVQNRRSYYAIGKEKVLSDEEIISLIEDAVKYAPTPFNSQSARAVVLLGAEHEKLWNETMEILRAIVPAKSFAPTEEKISSFRSGYGTVLYFEDQSVVSGLQEQFPLYKDNFPVWSLESSGMLQFIVWTALESKGYGASLQHYNPLIDEKVAANWNIPKDWKLLGQMPFGKPTASPDEKTFLPLEERVKVYK